MLRYLAVDIICSEKRTVFPERISRKTVSFEEQIISKDKYPSIFSPQVEAIAFIVLKTFFATRTVLEIGEYPRIIASFFWGIFGHVTCLDQSCESENIWWIIIVNNYLFTFKRVTSHFDALLHRVQAYEQHLDDVHLFSSLLWGWHVQ